MGFKKCIGLVCLLCGCTVQPETNLNMPIEKVVESPATQPYFVAHLDKIVQAPTSRPYAEMGDVYLNVNVPEGAMNINQTFPLTPNLLMGLVGLILLVVLIVIIRRGINKTT